MITPKKRRHLDFDTWKKQVLKNPAIKAEYDRMQPEYTLIQAVLDARLKRGVTQNQLARKIGTTQSVISRLESGSANPSFSFLKRIAQALHARLEIRFNM